MAPAGELGEEVGPHRLSDDLGGLDLLGEDQGDPIVVGEDLGGVGEAEADAVTLVNQAFSFIGEDREEFQRSTPRA